MNVILRLLEVSSCICTSKPIRLNIKIRIKAQVMTQILILGRKIVTTVEYTGNKMPYRLGKFLCHVTYIRISFHFEYR